MIFEQHTPFDAYASKRVSFILTTKNRAERLDRVLTLAREYVQPEDELIVVDGLSTDHTVEVINRHSNLVDIFLSEPDISCAHALNKGILLSRGRYIRHICDDDLTHPDAMEQAIQVLEEHPEVDLLVCGGTKQRGEHIYVVCLPPGTNYGKSVEDAFRYGSCGAGFIIKRSAIPLIGLLPIGAAADVGFVVQSISRGANVKFCRIKLYHHPIYDHSYTVKNRREWEMDVVRIRNQYGLVESRPRLKAAILQILRRYTPTFIKGPLRSIVKRLRKRRQIGSQENDSAHGGPLWDGGFS